MFNGDQRDSPILYRIYECPDSIGSQSNSGSVIPGRAACKHQCDLPVLRDILRSYLAYEKLRVSAKEGSHLHALLERRETNNSAQWIIAALKKNIHQIKIVVYVHDLSEMVADKKKSK